MDVECLGSDRARAATGQALPLSRIAAPPPWPLGRVPVARVSIRTERPQGWGRGATVRRGRGAADRRGTGSLHRPGRGRELRRVPVETGAVAAPPGGGRGGGRGVIGMHWRGLAVTLDDRQERDERVL